MSHTIEDMKSAYVFFNNARFGGGLPSPYGWGMSLCVGHCSDGTNAECNERRDNITFSDRSFGTDLHHDLYTLFHEMWHVHIGWDHSDSAYQVAISSHGDAWVAAMAANDIRVTSEIGHATVIPGGSFDRLRDEWIHQWEQGDSLPQECNLQPIAALWIAAVMAVVVFVGLSIVNGKDDHNGYGRSYSYGGERYNDY